MAQRIKTSNMIIDNVANIFFCESKVKHIKSTPQAGKTRYYLVAVRLRGILIKTKEGLTEFG